MFTSKAIKTLILLSLSSTAFAGQNGIHASMRPAHATPLGPTAVHL